jgi:hypothetical protein
MEEQFVPHEIAIKLKEKDFDWHCLAVYMNGEFQIPRGFGMAIVTKEHVNVLKGKAVLAPLWQQVIDWFREKHNLRIFESTPICGQSSKSFNEDFRFELVKISGNGGRANSVYGNGGLGSRYQTYPSYNEARQAAIEHALTLI